MEWASLSWPEFDELRKTVRVAVLPIGAIEEHGPHLPLNTDNLTADAFARRICEKTRCFLLPTLPYGQVWSLKRFPGSLTISNNTLKQFLLDLAQSLQFQGMQGLVVVSGHLGNMTALKEAARESEEQLRFPVMPLFYPALREAARDVLEAPASHPAIVHADELETSLVLALRPEVVRMDKAVSEYPMYPPDFDYVPTYWDEVSETGVFGNALLATKEKGERILTQVIAKTVELVEYFKEAVNASHE